MQVQLHPKSVWEVPGSWRSSAQPWDGYGDGRGALAGEEAREELLDRVRFFAEECDAMQARAEGQPSPSPVTLRASPFDRAVALGCHPERVQR